jgi:hypothetical protein
MSNTYLSTNAWREILARVFEQTQTQMNVSPTWLINPATRRRLKLDYLYPDLGIGVRFSGLTAKGQGRRSDWEVLEDEQRDQTRVALCEQNGVQLAVVKPVEDPVKQMDELLRILSRSSRLLAEEEMDRKRKQKGMDLLAKAHRRAADLRNRLAKEPDKMISTLAERWRDREDGLVTQLQSEVDALPEPPPLEKSDVAHLREGQRVHHSRYEDGVVVTIDGEGPEAKITILFDAAEEKTFLARLLTDKLQVVERR